MRRGGRKEPTREVKVPASKRGSRNKKKPRRDPHGVRDKAIGNKMPKKGTNPLHRCAIRWVTSSVCSAASTVRTRASERKREIRYPTVWDPHRLGGGVMRTVPVGHLWEQDTRRSPFDLVGRGGNNRPGCRHYPSGAGVDLGGPGTCAIGHSASGRRRITDGWPVDCLVCKSRSSKWPRNGVYATPAICWSPVQLRMG